MRTTITLDNDVEVLLDKLVQERSLSFKQAVNFAIREGLAPRGSNCTPFVQRTHDFGPCLMPAFNSTQGLSDWIEDEAILRKMDLGK